MRSKPPSMNLPMCRRRATTDHHFFRHGLNFIKLDGDIGCLGKATPPNNRLVC